MQKTKRHILSTRPLPQALVEEAAAQNIVIDEMSFIETKSIIDAVVGERIAELFQKPITAVFTSMNAVTAVSELFQKPIPWNVYSIGNTTANLITKLFQLPIVGTANDAEMLADVIIKDNIKEVYFFCGTIRRDVLPQKLRAANISVEEVFVYKTTETPQVVNSFYDAILFYSPSAVESFFSANKIEATTLLFAIGNTTAEKIKQHSGNTLIVSARTGKEDLIKETIAYFNKQN